MTTKRAKKPADLGAEIRRHTIVHNANRHLALYQKTGDGLLIWRAYLECREGGMRIPESLLKKFDEFAYKLGRANSAKEVAAAIEMDSDSGPAGAGRARGREHQRDIVEQVRAAVAAPAPRRPRMDAIFVGVAKSQHTTKTYVKTTYYQWMRQAGLGRRPKK